MRRALALDMMISSVLVAVVAGCSTIYPLKSVAFRTTDPRSLEQDVVKTDARHQMTRLVAPLVFSRLTRLGLALIPVLPSSPPIKHPSPSARTPAAMLRMSGRLHDASFIC